jgi:hypothetical protein
MGATVVYELPSYDLTDEERVSLNWIEEDLRQATDSDTRAYDRVSRKTFDEFLRILQDRLEGVRPVRPTPLGIACEDPDRPTVEGIIPEIRARTGFQVTCHGLSLLDFKKSRGLLFYWGTAEGSRLRQARVVARGLHEAFFLAPPLKPGKHESELRKEIGEGLILHQKGDKFRVDDIRPFLHTLGWSG